MKVVKNVYLAIILMFLVYSNSLGQNTFELNKKYKITGVESHLFKIDLKKGQFLELDLFQNNVDIQIAVLNNQKDTIKVFDSPNGENGVESIELLIVDNGNYYFEVSPFISNHYNDKERNNVIENIDGNFIIQRFTVLSEEEYNTKIIREKEEQNEVIQWIKNELIPIHSVNAETGFEDLLPLKDKLKNVQVVGLGEISHGSKEIFQMKHRMLEFLVKEMGFKIFAIEASHIGCRPINEYVLYGKGTSREALSAQGFWIWNTEEVIDMIEWMRSYNSNVAENEKVQFVGIDTQLVALDTAYKKISQYFKKIDIENKFDSLVTELTNINGYEITHIRKDFSDILVHFVLHKAHYVDYSSLSEYEDILSDLRKIIQSLESGDIIFQKQTPYNIRDNFMAQTVIEILQESEQKTKMVVWAHNSHISKYVDHSTNGYPEPLGSVLKEYLGDRYYAVGFSTNEGNFQAWDRNAKEGDLDVIKAFNFPPAKEGSLDWHFAESQNNMFFIDFRAINEETIEQYFNKSFSTYSGGAASDNDDDHIRKVKPSKNYDGMVFIRKTSRAVLTPGGKEEIKSRLTK